MKIALIFFRSNGQFFQRSWHRLSLKVVTICNSGNHCLRDCLIQTVKQLHLQWRCMTVTIPVDRVTSAIAAGGTTSCTYASWLLWVVIRVDGVTKSLRSRPGTMLVAPLLLRYGNSSRQRILVLLWRALINLSYWQFWRDLSLKEGRGLIVLLGLLMINVILLRLDYLLLDHRCTGPLLLVSRFFLRGKEIWVRLALQLRRSLTLLLFLGWFHAKLGHSIDVIKSCCYSLVIVITLRLNIQSSNLLLSFELSLTCIRNYGELVSCRIVNNVLLIVKRVLNALWNRAD